MERISRRDLIRLSAISASGALAGCAGTPNDTSVPTVTSESTTLEAAWTATLSGTRALSISTAGEDLYVTVDTGVAAIAKEDGRQQWQQGLSGSPLNNPMRSLPGDDEPWGITVSKQHVYTVFAEGDQPEGSTVHALARSDGAVSWTLEQPLLLSVLGAYEGTVFVLGGQRDRQEHSHDDPDPTPGTLLAVNESTGDIQWSRDFSNPNGGRVAADGTIYIADGTELHAFAPDGDKRWSVGASKWVYPPLLLDETIAVIAEAPGEARSKAEIFGVSLDGAKQWSREHNLNRALAHGSQLFLVGEPLLVVTADGSVAWRDENGAVGGLVSPDGDQLYAEQDSPGITAFDSSTGKPVWRFNPTPRHVRTTAATAEAAVFSANTEGGYKLYAVSQDGKFIGQYQTDSIVFQTISQRRMVFTALKGAKVVALEI